jgi:hypothetical protein
MLPDVVVAVPVESDETPFPSGRSQAAVPNALGPRVGFDTEKTC